MRETWQVRPHNMILICDPRQNIAYLRFHAKTAEVETIHVSDEINVDLLPDGTVYGIELLNANAQFGLEDAGQRPYGLLIKATIGLVW